MLLNICSVGKCLGAREELILQYSFLGYFFANPARLIYPFSRRHFLGTVIFRNQLGYNNVKSNISEQTNYLQSKFTIIHP